MADKSAISWTDATWNCIRGCTRVDEDCQNCYAEILAATRLAGPGGPYEGLAVITKAGRPHWTGHVMLVEHLFAATFVGFAITDYCTSLSFGPVKANATVSQTNHTGLAASLQAMALPVAVIAVGMWIAYSVGGGLYGVALAAAAMLSVAGIVLVMESYGPITDDADGIAEVSKLAHEMHIITDAPDAAGNTTKAVTKG
jgi:K(+)-stimulated pyrophosphate-energized sodium pump